MSMNCREVVGIAIDVLVLILRPIHLPRLLERLGVLVDLENNSKAEQYSGEAKFWLCPFDILINPSEGLHPYIIYSF
ncbi:hypothetical protein SUGI_0036170 [Cryptomeria japonica]|nr:hypothetical protein SUGI_0036170 [Cryptomeria japonica]